MLSRKDTQRNVLKSSMNLRIAAISSSLPSLLKVFACSRPWQLKITRLADMQVHIILLEAIVDSWIELKFWVERGVPIWRSGTAPNELTQGARIKSGFGLHLSIWFNSGKGWSVLGLQLPLAKNNQCSYDLRKRSATVRTRLRSRSTLLLLTGTCDN